MMKELYAGMLQFIHSVPQYMHSQREKRLKILTSGVFFSVTCIIQGHRKVLAKKKKIKRINPTAER